MFKKNFGKADTLVVSVNYRGGTVTNTFTDRASIRMVEAVLFKSPHSRCLHLSLSYGDWSLSIAKTVRIVATAKGATVFECQFLGDLVIIDRWAIYEVAGADEDVPAYRLLKDLKIDKS